MRINPPALAVVAAFALLPQAVAASGGEKAAGNTQNLVPMESITVPIVDADRISGKLRFKLVLQASDPSGAARLAAQAPQLRAVATSAGNEFSRLYASPAEAVNAEQLAHDLTAALHGAEPAVARALVVEIYAGS